MKNSWTNKAWLPYAGLTCTSLFWAGNAIIARGVNELIPPLTLSFFRWFTCALLVSPFIVKAYKKHRVIIREQWVKILILSFMSITTYNSLLYVAAQYTSALNITLVTSLMPITTIALSAPLLGATIGLRSAAGIACAFAGALYVILKGDFDALWRLELNTGDSIMAIAMLIWSLYSILLRKWQIPIPGLDLFMIFLGIGVIMISPFYLIEYQFRGGFEVSSQLLLAIIYVAIFPSLLAYLFWNFGVTQTSPSTASLFFYLAPLITALLAIPFLGELPHGYHGAGGLVIILGLWLCQSVGRKKTGIKQK
ncbi:EamA family transporter [Hahella sp. CCB-MM4]|uniref:DMT family transporter n=1 Tax=Hahella sp. (strain CCB-MM4) TaxID=1926491 RepID=UPI000B9C31C0|nr:DMT family transporter [Hahella sp. CCB-MM4]OZG71518.1 EamA family transporter [Hahella sp. CCB-MM4]